MPITRPGAKFHFGNHFRPHVTRLAGFLGRQLAAEGTLVSAHARGALEQIGGDGGGKAGADTADGFELAVPVDAEHDRADGLARDGGWRVAADDEFLLGRAF